MADIERLHYFNNQFLKEEDFTDEQTYHLDMRRRHNRLLHTPGIAEGLEVKKTGAKEVKVSPGTAIDSSGREIVLLKESDPISLNDLTKYPPKSTVYITITYKDKPPKKDDIGDDDDQTKWQQPDTNRDSNQYTRTLEKAIIEAKTTEPDSTTIKLARFKLDANGNISGDINSELNDGVRQKATAKLPTFSISIQQLKTETVASSEKEPIKNLQNIPVQILAYDSSSVSSTNKRIGAFLLVYAYSDTPGTQFTWRQTYSTEMQDQKLIYRQFVEFTNITPLGTPIKELHYTIYALSEEE